MSETGPANPLVANNEARCSSRQPLGITVSAVAGVMALALLFGWPTRQGDFLSGDDQRFVTDHVLVNHPSWPHAWELLTIRHGDLYQPLPMLSFQANCAVAAAEPDSRFGVSPYGFHLTNIALHMLNAGLACLLASAITRRRLVGFLTGTMFACHPFAIEPIAWISGRMMLLATTFALAAVLLCVRHRGDARGGWPWLAGIAWVFSLMSKALPTVPIAAALCDRARHETVRRRAWGVYAVFLALAAIATFGAVATSHEAGFVAGADGDSDAGWVVRGLLACRYYLENYCVPAGLAAWSPPPLGVSLTSFSTVVSIVECAAFVAALLLARRFSRTAFLGLVLFAILLAPFLAASAGRRLLAADRYMYLPIFGLHLALSGVAVQLVDSLRKPRAVRGFALAPVAVLLCYWLVAGRSLAPCWADTVSRDRRGVAVYPQSVLAHAELAKAHLFENDPDAALRVVTEARHRLGDHPRLAAQAGEAYHRKRDWPRAEVELRTAAEAMPDHVRTQYYYALTLDQLGRHNEARRRFEDICARHEAFHPAAAALARSYAAAGDVYKAVAAWRLALKRKPFDRNSAYELSLLLLGRGEAAEAAQRLRDILAMDPDDRPARFHLAVALSNQGQPAAAIEHYDRLIAENAGEILVRLNRAAVLEALGRDNNAESDYRAALRLEPNSLDAATGLHAVLFRAGRLPDILSLWTGHEGRGPESVACRVWANVLNQRLERAQALIATIPESTPARYAANWALAYDALRRSADDDLEKFLGEPRTGSPDPTDWRPMRIIAPALSGLDPTIRDSTAGRYTLARLFHYAGDESNARRTADQIIREVAPDRWTEAAGDLIRVLDDPHGGDRVEKPQAPSKPANQ